MCIIIYKPKNRKLPSDEIIKESWKNNNHGAGIMYRERKRIHIQKGYMTLDALQTVLNGLPDAKKLDLCIHMRVSTTGSIRQENTHPFPLSHTIADLQSLDIVCDRAIAHNGILPDYAKFHDESTDLSDTMYFSKALSGVRDKYLSAMLNNHDGRFVLMTGTDTHIIGMHKDGGLYFSNRTYKPRIPYVSSVDYDDIGKWYIPQDTQQCMITDIDQDRYASDFRSYLLGQRI